MSECERGVCDKVVQVRARTKKSVKRQRSYSGVLAFTRFNMQPAGESLKWHPDLRESWPIEYSIRHTDKSVRYAMAMTEVRCSAPVAR